MLDRYLAKYNAMPIQVRASLWFFICSFLQKGIATITTPIFTRLLTADEYGQYSVFNSWLGIVTVFVSLNLYYGVYNQGLVKFSKDRPVFSSSLQGLTFTLVCGWTLIYALMSDFWNALFHLTTVQMLCMMALIWLSAVYNFWSSEQRVEFQYRRIVQITLTGSVLTPILGIYMVLHAEDKVTARILSTVIVNAVLYSGLFIWHMRRGKTIYSTHYWRYALGFNLPLIPHYLSGTLLSSADRIMIQNMVSASAAGIYSLGYSVSQVMTIFNTAMQQTLEPWRYKKIHDGRAADIAGMAYPTLMLIAGVNLLLMVFAPELVALFAPPAYYDAIWIIPPVSMSVYFIFSYGYFAVFEFYFAKTRFIAVSTMAGAVMNIVLNYIFIGWFGYYAAGYTTLLCYMIYAGCHYHFMQRICRENLKGQKIYDRSKLIKISLGFMVIGFLIMATYPYLYLRYGLLGIMLLAGLIKRRWLIETIRSVIEAKKIGKNK
ncbi:oligosaccharide flippase family protein [Selenomonas sp. AE3005]|uniref:oligosaccharide flippase family protein n=1 Tax=Selenomonas sp. AE3005 TaxID=1485543 RepID=UPI000484B714|nr:oligosaccharide flippase family protein [Selenomonas sp. AE3005]